MTEEESRKLDIIAAYIGSPLTDEQKEFASDFTKDTISFSDPGTGKTHTLVAGLIMAQRHHMVPGDKINCMSFTRAATSEVAARYEKLCKACSVSPTVKFNTFHALSNAILVDAYNHEMHVNDNFDTIKQDVHDLMGYMQQLGISVDENDLRYVRSVLNAINTLNASLVFHPDNVANKFEFIQLNMPIEQFQELRVSMFMRGLISKSINVGDIPLYCLYALMKRQEVIKKWKSKYRIMVVDEFQDLSLLHLHILSYIAETLIVIGDMKQQIYEFNGACPHIVAEYKKMHPNARICNLTKSFRCGQEVADFATAIIKPDEPDIVPFTGHNHGSSVTVVKRSELDWKQIVGNMAAEKRLGGFGNMTNIMFLYRNNASAIPVIEELYKEQIPFRCSKFAKIMDIPIFKTLSKLCNAAWQPNNTEFVDQALKCFPEFKNSEFGKPVAPILAMKSSGKNIFEINYRYREDSSIEILNAMSAAAKAINEGKSAGVTYMKLMQVYDKYLYKLEWWTVDHDKEFYFNLVGNICNTKPYPLMYNEEMEKDMQNRQSLQSGFGVRCYTMHAAKGLEADDVYILDADEGVFPNSKILKKKQDVGCYKDIAVSIISERNLLYVAITRARRNVYISYSGNAVTKLISDPNDNYYTQWAKYYDKDIIEYDDADEFYKLFKIGAYGNESNNIRA